MVSRFKGIQVAVMAGLVTTGLVQVAGQPASAETTPSQPSPVLVERTETADIYDNGDGTKTARVHAGPVNFKDATGSYRPIDTRLKSSTKGHESSGGPLTVRIATTADAERLLAVGPASGGTWEISFRANGAARVSGVVDGPRISFGKAFGPATLEYEVLPYGVKEAIRLDAPPGPTFPSRFTFPISTTGVQPVPDPQGGVAFVDGAGSVEARVPNGVAFDASGTGAATPVTVQLVSGTDGSALEVSVDAGWLRDPSRVYPVVIDPSIQAGRQSGHWDTFAYSGCANCNYNGYVEGNAYSLKVGRNPTTLHEYYSYLKYGLEAVAGHQIVSARWRALFYDSPAGAWYRMYPAAGSWEDYSLTWSNQPGHRSENITVGGPGSNAWSSVDVTSWVSKWSSNAWGSFGLSIDTAGQNWLFRLAAMEQYWKAEDSYIDIVYRTVPSAPQAVDATALPREVVVDWEAPATDGGSAVTHFDVSLYRGATVGSGTRVATKACSEACRSALFDGLEDDVPYYGAVTAANAVGASQPGYSQVVRTPVVAPEDPARAHLPGRSSELGFVRTISGFTTRDAGISATVGPLGNSAVTYFSSRAADTPDLTLLPAPGSAPTGSVVQTSEDLLAADSVDGTWRREWRALPGGVGTVDTLRSSAAPTTFETTVSLPMGWTLVQSAANGPIRLLDAAGLTAGHVSPATAHDANGVAVPATTTLTGAASIVVAVPHSAANAYPVTVDPYYYRGGKLYKWRYGDTWWGWQQEPRAAYRFRQGEAEAVSEVDISLSVESKGTRNSEEPGNHARPTVRVQTSSTFDSEDPEHELHVTIRCKENRRGEKDPQCKDEKGRDAEFSFNSRRVKDREGNVRRYRSSFDIRTDVSLGPWPSGDEERYYFYEVQILVGWPGFPWERSDTFTQDERKYRTYDMTCTSEACYFDERRPTGEGG